MENQAGINGDQQGNSPITDSYNITIHEQRFKTETEDESKDKNNKRDIEKHDATANRWIKIGLVSTTILMAISVSLVGLHIAFNHKDAKVREIGASLISAPIVGLFGILAGMAFK